MAQFSVPSSEFSVIESNATLTAVNGSDRVDVVNDPQETKYLHALDSDPVDGGYGRIVYGMQALVDPFVDTDHKIHIVVRSVPGATAFIDFALGINDISEIFWTVRLTEVDLTSSFNELIYTLLATEVQALRAAGAYTSGLQFVVSAQLDPLGYTDVAYIQFETPGAAAVSWWYKASTDEYKYQASSPGAGYVETTPPVMKAYGEENPIQGVSTGGTAIIISGDGFADGLTVTFGGVSATSIVVVNQHTITCNTPAFGGSLSDTQIVDVGDGVMKSANVALATVTVTNPDGQSASM